jgi:hypothetical protein
MSLAESRTQGLFAEKVMYADLTEMLTAGTRRPEAHRCESKTERVFVIILVNIYFLKNNLFF